MVRGQCLRPSSESSPVLSSPVESSPVLETPGWFGRGNAASNPAGTATESTLLCEFLSPLLRHQVRAAALFRFSRLAASVLEKPTYSQHFLSVGGNEPLQLVEPVQDDVQGPGKQGALRNPRIRRSVRSSGTVDHRAPRHTRASGTDLLEDKVLGERFDGVGAHLSSSAFQFTTSVSGCGISSSARLIRRNR